MTYSNRPFTPAELDYHATWRPASGHPGGWRVCRQFFHDGADPMLHQLMDKRGRVILFRSQASAAKRAAQMQKDQTNA